MKRKHILKKIKAYIKKSQKEIIILFIVKIFFILLTMVSPYFIRLIIDKVMYNAQSEIFVIVVLGMTIAFVIRFILDYITIKCENKIFNRTSFLIRRDILKKYLSMNYNDYEKKDISNLKMTVFDDVENLGNFVNNQVVAYFYNILLSICSLGLCLYTDAKVTLICCSIFPIIFYINTLIGKGLKKVNEEIRKANKEYYAFEYDSLQHWQEIKAQNIENDFINRFKEHRKILARYGYKWIIYWAFSEVYTDIKVNYLTKILVYIVGSIFVLNGDLTMGVLVMLSEYFSTLFTSLDTLNNKRTEIVINSPYYKRVFEVLNMEVKKANMQIDFNENWTILLRNVSFKYSDNSNYAVKNVSMKITNGDYILLCGESGCGKSTLLKLILNTHKVNDGTVTLNDIDINHMNKKSLYEHVGVVMQDSYLFNYSVKDNLLMANRYIGLSEMKKVCQQVNIHEFITSLPDGYDTVIGENGNKLSGGQKQRLMIAKALIKTPKLLILDEATSALDQISQKVINNILDTKPKDMTIISATHNKLASKKATKIVQF